MAIYRTEKEVAERYRISVALLRKLRWLRHPPRVTRFGRAVRYSDDDLAAWEEECRRQSEVSV